MQGRSTQSTTRRRLVSHEHRPAPSVIGRSIGRLRGPSRHAESRQCTAAVGHRRRLRPCSIGARRHDLQARRHDQPFCHARPRSGAFRRASLVSASALRCRAVSYAEAGTLCSRTSLRTIQRPCRGSGCGRREVSGRDSTSVPAVVPTPTRTKARRAREVPIMPQFAFPSSSGSRDGIVGVSDRIFSLSARRAVGAPERLNSPVCFSYGERGCHERAHDESSRTPAFERHATADLYLVGSRAEHPSSLLLSSAPPTLPA
jgi:hypothetical protein